MATEDASRFDLVVRVNPWRGDHSVPLDEALGGVVWSIEVNGHQIAKTPDEAHLSLDPFPTLWLGRVQPDGWVALDANPGHLIPPPDGQEHLVGIPVTKIEFVMEHPVAPVLVDGDDPLAPLLDPAHDHSV